VYPNKDGSVGGDRAPVPDLRLDCDTGFGTASFVTGTFGLVAASRSCKESWRRYLVAASRHSAADFLLNNAALCRDAATSSSQTASEILPYSFGEQLQRLAQQLRRKAVNGAQVCRVIDRLATGRSVSGYWMRSAGRS